MAAIALLIDVGSTWTKGLAVSLPEGRLTARYQHPTTLADGIMVGVNAVIDELKRSSGDDVVFRASSSSAAGGLRVAALGLVPDLTVVAARQASLGAGARVVFNGSYVLTSDEIDAMRSTSPDIVLLSGGTDGGNSAVILENARKLAEAKLAAAVVLAGNKSARTEARQILEAAGIEVRIADNVLPTIEAMNVESAQAAIRELFLERIATARGIEGLRHWAAGQMLPTPRAVLDAARFLSDGLPGLGSLVIADIGGATTDVHSIGGSEAQPGVVIRGLPEPRVKRTVEGDLGLRVSAAAAADVLGAESLARKIGATAEDLRKEADRRVKDTALLAREDTFDRVMAIAAVAEALSRHCGQLEPLPLRKDQWLQTGKDLRRANLVIASGGVFAGRSDADEMLEDSVREAAKSGRLVPETPRRLVDRSYCLFAVGLLAQSYPEAAAALAIASLGMED